MRYFCIWDDGSAYETDDLAEARAHTDTGEATVVDMEKKLISIDCIDWYAPKRSENYHG